MAVFKGENNTRNADQLQGENSMWLCLRGSGAETLESVATSQAVSVRVLLATRIFSLAVLVLGGLWISWRSGEPPLCLPDWSYLTSSAYFVVCFPHRHPINTNNSCSGFRGTRLFFSATSLEYVSTSPGRCSRLAVPALGS